VLLGATQRRFDFAYPHVKFGIEVDGYDRHGKRDVFEDDRLRQNLMVVEGWTILRFTWRQIRRNPEEVARQIRAVLRRLSHPRVS
jgi:very-short-patch-repair endonuclease